MDWFSKYRIEKKEIKEVWFLAPHSEKALASKSNSSTKVEGSLKVNKGKWTLYGTSKNVPKNLKWKQFFKH